MNKTILLWFQKYYQKLFLVLFMLILIINTLYSFDYKSWIWTGEISTWQKIIGISISLSAILGVLSVVFFAMHKNIAYILGISNAILYALFAFSFGLAIDGFINFVIYIPIMFLTWYKTTRIKNSNNLFESFRSNIYSTSFFGFLTVLLTISFYYANPLVNKFVLNLLGKDGIEVYGNNFKYFTAGNILISLISALSIVALTMMVMGFRDSWIIWIIKNFVSFAFFGGIGFVNITTLLINVIYMLISLHLFLITTNKRKISIAFSHQFGLLELKEFFNKHNFEIYEADFYDLEDSNKNEYKKHLKESLKLVKASQFTKYNVFNNYLLDDILALDKIKIKSFYEKLTWKYLKLRYKISLAMQNKLDYIFILPNSESYYAYKNKTNWRKFAKEVIYFEDSLISNVVIEKLDALLTKQEQSNFKKYFTKR